MKYIELNEKATLTNWEINPNKRNQNNIISFVALDEVFIQEKDTLFVRPTAPNTSTYFIVEILEKRPSSLGNMIYYKAVSTWSMLHISKIIDSHNPIVKPNTMGVLNTILENEN